MKNKKAKPSKSCVQCGERLDTIKKHASMIPLQHGDENKCTDCIIEALVESPEEFGS